MYSDLPHIVIKRAPGGTKLEDIKALRRVARLGLKEAKEKIDNLANGHSYIYASDIGAHTENEMFAVSDALITEGFAVNLLRSTPPDVHDFDPLRGVAYQAAVLAVVFAAEEGDVALALSKVSTLATVTQDPTFKAMKVILGEAQDRLNGSVKESLLGHDCLGQPTA